MSRPAISYPIPSGTNGADTLPPPSMYDGSAGGGGSGSSSGGGHMEPNIAGAGAGGAGGGQPLTRIHSGGPTRAPASTLDSFITRLLVVTKQLLQGLDQWSQGMLSEEDVSDIYVRLGNGFELCVAAFRRVGISTADLDSVPRDLREILERALAEEPSQDTLNLYLPDIRAIIFNLLSGLKNKQISYKRLLADRQQSDPMPAPTPSRPPRALSSSTIASAEGHVSPSSITSQLPPGGPRPPSATALAERSQHRSAGPRPAPPDAFRPTRTRSGESSRQDTHSSISSQLSSPVDPRRIPQPPPTATAAAPVPTAGPSRTARHPDRVSRDSFGNVTVTSRFSADSDMSTGSARAPATAAAAAAAAAAPTPAPTIVTVPSPIPEAPAATGDRSPSKDDYFSPLSATKEDPFTPPTTVTPPDQVQRPPVVPVLNVPGGGGGGGSGSDELSPPLASTPVNDHAVRQSLTRLQKSDALERRASKRFSSYTFNKMLPGSPSGNRKSTQNGSPQRPSRRSDRLPPMPAVPEDGARVTPPDLSVGDGTALSVYAPTAPSSPTASNRTMEEIPMSGTGAPAASPAGLGLNMDMNDTSAITRQESNTSGVALATPASVSPPPTSLNAFLQLGRQVKKATIELPLTMSALRLLFMERFEYDPGMEDFPDVYIRDNRTGVQYELEDMDDVREGVVLTLDIEPLDQVKQHFDLTFATLAQEIKDLKSAFTAPRRQSMQVPAASLLSVSASVPNLAVPVPTPAIRVAVPEPVVVPEPPRPAPQRTASGSTIIAPTTDLRRHHDEVQSLRRDLAIMRQLHLDFLSQTKESFNALRAQNSAMREVVKTKMGGSRALLDNSKAKLEGQCQDTIQSVEEVSDIIDGAREDALRRGITPSRTKMDKIRADLSKATSYVEIFASDVTLAEPTWRATWLSELQRVTEEQRLLAYQNKLATDLKNDIKDATDMLDNVQAFVEQRQAGGGAKKGFRPPSPDQGAGGMSNLLMEIRTKESDPTQRLRAIEEQQRAREKDLANRTDEFQNELSGFVEGKKLRKTGGTDEADRVRQRRQDITIKRMLTGDAPGSPPSVVSPQVAGLSLRD